MQRSLTTFWEKRFSKRSGSGLAWRAGDSAGGGAMASELFSIAKTTEPIHDGPQESPLPVLLIRVFI